MGKLPLKWILIGLLVLVASGYVSVQTTEQFTDGKDMWPAVPELSVPDAPVLSTCSNGTRAREGRCPEFLGP